MNLQHKEITYLELPFNKCYVPLINKDKKKNNLYRYVTMLHIYFDFNIKRGIITFNTFYIP